MYWVYFCNSFLGGGRSHAVGVLGVGVLDVLDVLDVLGVLGAPRGT